MASFIECNTKWYGVGLNLPTDDEISRFCDENRVVLIVFLMFIYVLMVDYFMHLINSINYFYNLPKTAGGKC